MNNLEKGYFTEEVRVVHHPKREKVEEVYHLEPITQPSVKKVIDIQGQEPCEAWDEEVKTLIYHEYTEIELLRIHREKECFPIINRGKLWYDTLTETQLAELKEWYIDWLNVTETLQEPTAPSWLNGKVNIEQEIIL